MEFILYYLGVRKIPCNKIKIRQIMGFIHNRSTWSWCFIHKTIVFQEMIMQIDIKINEASCLRALSMCKNALSMVFSSFKLFTTKCISLFLETIHVWVYVHSWCKIRTFLNTQQCNTTHLFFLQEWYDPITQPQHMACIMALKTKYYTIHSDRAMHFENACKQTKIFYPINFVIQFQSIFFIFNFNLFKAYRS